MKILISLTDELLSEIDNACLREERKRTDLIRIAIKHYLKSEKLIESTISKASDPTPPGWSKCDMNFCKSEAVGKSKVPVNDGQGGTIDTEMNLCKFHLHKFEHYVPTL